jgi:broad specificity phosphatase PhoE
VNDGSEPDAMTRPPTRLRAVAKYFGTALAALLLVFAVAIPASAAELMRITFVRHGESTGNASGLIDTTTPGPVLTPKGQQQAQDLVGTLGDNNYDAIYASTMVRTQLTAAPMSQYLRLPIQVLPGLQEIEAGVFEGAPEATADRGYGLYPLGWAFPGLITLPNGMTFDKSSTMPGTTLNGFAFDERVDGALKTIYDNGDRNAVVFSHGGTIMFWTMMNVNNLTMEQKLQLLQTARLDNTDYVVIEGNPDDGWTLVNGNGQQFAPEPTLGNEVKLQVRTLTRQLDAVHQQVVAAFATGDFKTIATAVNRGIADASYSVTKFTRAVNAKVIHEVDKVLAPESPAPSSVGVAAVNSATETVTAAGTAKKSNAAEAPKLEAVETNVASNGATKLTDGNKSVPGQTQTGPARPGHRLADILKDVSDRVTTSLQKLSGPKKTDSPATSGSDSESDGSGAGDTGGQQSDAA